MGILPARTRGHAGGSNAPPIFPPHLPALESVPRLLNSRHPGAWAAGLSVTRVSVRCLGGGLLTGRSPPHRLAVLCPRRGLAPFLSSRVPRSGLRQPPPRLWHAWRVPPSPFRFRSRSLGWGRVSNSVVSIFPSPAFCSCVKTLPAPARYVMPNPGGTRPWRVHTCVHTCTYVHM